MGLNNCHNVSDLRKLAKHRLPGPIFHYIDGAAEDEQTYRRNTAAYGDCDLVPNVLVDVENVDMSVEVMGQIYKVSNFSGLHPSLCIPVSILR